MVVVSTFNVNWNFTLLQPLLIERFGIKETCLILADSLPVATDINQLPKRGKKVRMKEFSCFEYKQNENVYGLSDKYAKFRR